MTGAFAFRVAGALLVLGLIVSCAGEPQRLNESEVRAVLDAPDRTEADRANDSRRKAP